MPLTQADLQSFQTFAAAQLSEGEVENLQELLDRWNARRAHQASVAGIQQSVEQYDAGEGLPVDQAFDEVRNKLGWTE